MHVLDADYLAIGHVTIDRFEDGSLRPGGTALYAALQAARLGLRARILTRGEPSEIERLLAPYGGELEVDVLRAPCTTTLLTSGAGSSRRQRVLAWAGPIDPVGELRGAIVHLAPVARETPARPVVRAELLGLTPQGLARRWEPRFVGHGGDGAEIVLGEPDPAQSELAARCGALVLSEAERESCSGLIAAALRGGASVAITAGGASKTLLRPGAGAVMLPPFAAKGVRDDLGAGDVFAAAFFVALHEGREAAQAARFASAAAALRIEGSGLGAIAGRAPIELRLAGC